jgi:hypothetical protein
VAVAVAVKVAVTVALGVAVTVVEAVGVAVTLGVVCFFFIDEATGAVLV